MPEKLEAVPYTKRREIRPLRLVDEQYCGRDLAKVLLRKIARRLFRIEPGIEPVANFNGLLIFDRADLSGGGLTFGQDFSRLLMEVGLRRCRRMFEFCAGPSYIGYALLLKNFCDHLVLADVNPVAVEAARQTARFNGIEDRVTIYLSDALDQIPESEKWDLVVGNPPHFSSWDREPKLLGEDPDWNLHRRFFTRVSRFLNPGAHVILQENNRGSNPELFREMIEHGGGRFLGVRMGPNLPENDDMLYYVLGVWD